MLGESGYKYRRVLRDLKFHNYYLIFLHAKKKMAHFNLKLKQRVLF